jgi:hypothetical protein
MKLLELFNFIIVSEETCQYLYVSCSLFIVMYSLVFGIIYRDIHVVPFTGYSMYC